MSEGSLYLWCGEQVEREPDTVLDTPHRPRGSVTGYRGTSLTRKRVFYLLGPS